MREITIEKNDNYVTFRTDNRIIRINNSEILYINNHDGYTELITENKNFKLGNIPFLKFIDSLDKHNVTYQLAY